MTNEAGLEFKEIKLTKTKAFANSIVDPYTNKIIQQAGMDLRDWFAGQALQGLISSFNGDEFQPDYQHETMDHPSKYYIAKSCYSMADAMMKAREK